MSRCGNLQGRSCTLPELDVKVKNGLAEWVFLYFDNLVIFSWLFKHKLRGGFTVQLARHT